MNKDVVEKVVLHESAKLSLKNIKGLRLKMLKLFICFVIFIILSLLISGLTTIHGKDIPEAYFSNGYPTIIGLLDSEFFMGIISIVTLSVIIYVLWLLWELHEVAVHKAQAVASQQIELVFALSLCGLFINKAWWVMALIIAFTRWDIISQKLSEIIANGRAGDKK